MLNNRLVNFLNQDKRLLLDGGMSNQLEAQGFDLNHELWSAQILLSDPSAIVDSHLHYLKAGAQCLITASYQASLSGLIDFGLNKQQAKALIISSVDLAHQAIEVFLSHNKTTDRPFIAASVGPYGARLADGSEYHGNYGVNDKVLERHHQEQIQILSQTRADILACETIPSMQEARVLKKLLERETKPAWVSFSCQNGQQLNDGTAIEDCVKEFQHCDNPIALGINCTNPKYVEELIQRIKSICPNKFIIAYPNSGEDYDPLTKTWHGTASPRECGNAAKLWVKAGANIVGGCCRMGPEHIASIKGTINKTI